MGRGTTIAAAFSVGVGLFLLIQRGILNPAIGQILLVGWVMTMRNLAMPAAVDSAVQAEQRDAQQAAAAAAARGSNSGGKGGGGSARKQRGKDE